MNEITAVNYPSYFLFKSEIKTANVCHNANSKLCKKCFEPECELAGREREQ